MAERRFPIMRPERYRGFMSCPRSVPFGLLAPQAKQALDNHDQSLKRLAERGGLAPCEAVAIIEGRPWRAMSDEDSIEALLAHLRVYEGSELVQLRAQIAEAKDAALVRGYVMAVATLAQNPPACHERELTGLLVTAGITREVAVEAGVDIDLDILDERKLWPTGCADKKKRRRKG